MRQFPQVDSKFGAPMGRPEYGTTPTELRSVRLYKVIINPGGYDAGGAYWGTGGPLYCAESDGYRRFCRGGKLQVVVDLALPRNVLVVPPMKAYRKLFDLEQRGTISASGRLLRIALQELGYK